MKKILFILLSILCSFSLFGIAGASSIFSDDEMEIHYCKDYSCGLIEGLKYIKASLVGSGIETQGTASDYIQRILIYLLTFLKLFAIILIIYAGFVMLTSIGNEERFKKGKTIIIFTIIGLIIIYLAGPIVTFIIGIFTNS